MDVVAYILLFAAFSYVCIRIGARIGELVGATAAYSLLFLAEVTSSWIKKSFLFSVAVPFAVGVVYYIIQNM